MRTEWSVCGPSGPSTYAVVRLRTKWSVCGRSGPSVDGVVRLQTQWSVCGRSGPSADGVVRLRTEWSVYGRSGPSADGVVRLRTQWSVRGLSGPSADVAAYPVIPVGETAAGHTHTPSACYTLWVCVDKAPRRANWPAGLRVHHNHQDTLTQPTQWRRITTIGLRAIRSFINKRATMAHCASHRSRCRYGRRGVWQRSVVRTTA